jgi:hypothetical protein
MHSQLVHDASRLHQQSEALASAFVDGLPQEVEATTPNVRKFVELGKGCLPRWWLMFAHCSPITVFHHFVVNSKEGSGCRCSLHQEI